MMAADNDTRDTPHDLFAELTALYGRPFRLDVCANHQNTKVPDCYYTLGGLASNGTIVRADVHGLSGPWPMHWFCNPPFSDIGTWVEKAWAVTTPGLMVIPNTREEQPFWQQWIEPYRDGRRGAQPGMLALTTHYLAKRRRFLEDGRPILQKDGKLGAPRFGVVALIWR